MKEQKKLISEDSKCTFKPSLNVCSEFLIETNFERQQESKEQKIERLYKENALRNIKLQDLKEHQDKK